MLPVSETAILPINAAAISATPYLRREQVCETTDAQDLLRETL